MNDGRGVSVRRRVLRTCQEDGHLLGIGTEIIERCQRFITCKLMVGITIIQFSKYRIVFQSCIISIGISAITATIDITLDRGIDTYGRATIHLSGNIITTIYIIDISTFQCQVSRKTVRKGSPIDTDGLLWMIHIASWNHISLTAATIDIIDLDSRFRFDSDEHTFKAGHVTLITTGIEVTDLTTLQIPYRTNSHGGLIVSTEETTNLEIRTLSIGITWVVTHRDNTIIGD